MRLLLVGILTFIPLVAQAKSLGDPGDSDVASLAITSPSPSDASDSLPDEGGLLRNPYSPDSPTNFEPFIGPYLYVQGQGEWVLYDPRAPHPFSAQDREPGHFHSADTRSAAGITSTQSWSQASRRPSAGLGICLVGIL
jgi:hypothetical protein